MQDDKSSAVQPRAFAAEHTDRFDMSGVAAYGAIVPLMRSREVTPMNVDLAVDTIARGLRENAYDPERDYLIHTGPGPLVTALVAVAAELAAKGGARRVKLLMFESKTARYLVRVMDLSRVAAPVADF